jgi:predicted tellurium resistance membrane protein TerC
MEMFEWMFTIEGWVALATLTLLEVVLGIDNVIFVSIAASKLPIEVRAKARQIGLFLAMFLRIALLSVLTALAGLTDEIFSVLGHGFSLRDVILGFGGLYLIYKATIEISDMVRAKSFDEHAGPKKTNDMFFMVVTQIAIVDVVFAIDSILTAVGMTSHLPIMVAAVVIAVLVMMFASGMVSAFIEKNPTTKMLALVFLFMIGLVLVADGMGFHIDRAYIYVVVIFSIVVETLNTIMRGVMEKHAMQNIIRMDIDEKNEKEESGNQE